MNFRSLRFSKKWVTLDPHLYLRVKKNPKCGHIFPFKSTLNNCKYGFSESTSSLIRLTSSPLPLPPTSEPEAYLGGDPAHGRAAQHGEGGDPRLVLQPPAEGEAHQPLQQHHPSPAEPDLLARRDAQSPLLQPPHGAYRRSTRSLLGRQWFLVRWFLTSSFCPAPSHPRRYRVTVSPRSPPASAQQVSCNRCSHTQPVPLVTRSQDD